MGAEILAVSKRNSVRLNNISEELFEKKKHLWKEQTKGRKRTLYVLYSKSRWSVAKICRLRIKIARKKKLNLPNQEMPFPKKTTGLVVAAPRVNRIELTLPFLTF